MARATIAKRHSTRSKRAAGKANPFWSKQVETKYVDDFARRTKAAALSLDIAKEGGAHAGMEDERGDRPHSPRAAWDRFVGRYPIDDTPRTKLVTYRSAFEREYGRAYPKAAAKAAAVMAARRGKAGDEDEPNWWHPDRAGAGARRNPAGGGSIPALSGWIEKQTRGMREGIGMKGMVKNPDVERVFGTAVLGIPKTMFLFPPNTLDQTLEGPTTRISSDTPVTIMGLRSQRGKSGKKNRRFYVHGNYYGVNFYGWVYEEELNEIKLSKSNPGRTPAVYKAGLTLGKKLAGGFTPDPDKSILISAKKYIRKHGDIYQTLAAKVEAERTFKQGAYDGYGGVLRGVKSNPEDAAESMYETFHGRPSTEILEVEETVHFHSNLAALGELIELKVATLKNKEATLGFDGCGTTLASDEDGKQLFVVGGDQSLDLDALGLSKDERSKELVTLGTLLSVVYQTEKSFDQFEVTQYEHTMGEKGGTPPDLIYDVRNKQLQVAGGSYQIQDVGIIR